MTTTQLHPAPSFGAASTCDAVSGENMKMAVLRERADSARQQLIRFETLFQLVDELRSVDEISAMVELVATRWKYIFTAESWRLVVAHDAEFEVIETVAGRGQATTISELPAWEAHQFQDKHPCIITDIDLAVPVPPPSIAGPRVTEILVRPFVRDQACAGLITVAASSTLNDLDKKFIAMFGELLFDHMSLVFLRRAALERLRSLASRDALTGAWNRGVIVDRLASQLALASRTGEQLSVLVVDADHFKAINDTYGHLAGDNVLRELARRFSTLTRSSESFGRYGGEEFLFVLYPCRPEEAMAAAARLVAGISERPFYIDEDGTKQIDVTVSIGVASSDTQIVPTVETLIESADRALYLAKAGGRNRAVQNNSTNSTYPAKTRGKN